MELSPKEAAKRIEHLEALLAHRDAEVAELRLSLEVFSSIDTRTGLPNLNAVVDALLAAVDVLRRHGEAFSVIGVRFPKLSEAATVESVRHLGAVVEAALREIDRVGILSPESFIAIARDCDDTGAAALIERLGSALGAGQVPEGVETPMYSSMSMEKSGEIRPDIVIDRVRRSLDRETPIQVVRLDPAIDVEGDE
ncbi:MAG: GGDEF domain-containing protein [Acidimicrobiia bacterium]|nr:GGDEF domain-containing protein [Acidimicrobiia bacterium]